MEVNYNHILQYFSENLTSVKIKAHEEANELKKNFEYTFTAFIFAGLALSVQFSPGFGTKGKWLLIFSWGILFISGISGGYRLMLIPELLRLSGIKDYLEKRISMGNMLIPNQSFIAAIKAGLAINPDTFKPQTMEDLKEGYEEDKKKLDLCNLEVNNLDKRLPIAFYIQLYGFLISYFLLGIFVIINFL